MEPNTFKYFNLKGYKTSVKILKVYDGDTITVSFPFPKIEYIQNLEKEFINGPDKIKESEYIFKWKCRLKKIDTTEFTDNMEKATLERDHLSKLLNTNDDIIIYCENYDKYGRLLVDIYINNTNIIDLMIKEYPYINKIY